MKNVFYLSLALVGLTFGLIACGEDDGGGTTPPPAATWTGTYPGTFSGYAVLGLDTTQLDSTASATLTAGANAGEAILDVTLPPLSETLPVSVTVSVSATYVENADGTTSIDVANQEASGVPIPGVFVSGTGSVSGNTLTADVVLSGVVSGGGTFTGTKQ